MGLLFLLPLAVAPIALFAAGREKAGAGYLLGAIAAGAAWLAATGYVAYRAWLAIP